MRTAKLLPLPLGLVLAAAVSGCAGQLPTSSMKMTVGYTAIGAAYSDLYVCEDQGSSRRTASTSS